MILTLTDFRATVLEDASVQHPAILGTESQKGVTVKGTHYSHRPNLYELAGTMNGTGIKGAEGSRLATAQDHRIKSRVYFYNRKNDHPKSHVIRPEAGLGSHVYTSTLHGIYDPHTASDEHHHEVQSKREAYVAKGHDKMNAFESAVVDSGYHGYTASNMTVVLNHDHVPVNYRGQRHEIA